MERTGSERWVPGPGVPCYDTPPACQVDRARYQVLRTTALASPAYEDFTVAPCSGRAWKLPKGNLCRVSVIAGAQVGDLNFWNLGDPRERFFSGKTRQLHAAHLSTYDRLWSCLPFLRPMATVVKDSIQYGVDPDGAGVHDVIGTRCDQYTARLIAGHSGDDAAPSCHGNLTAAVREFGLTESDVHDVWNIFMCTGFSRDEGRYFTKPSPARRGDHVEFIAEMDLLVALSVCPQGDVSVPVGRPVPSSLRHPLGVQLFRGV